MLKIWRISICTTWQLDYTLIKIIYNLSNVLKHIFLMNLISSGTLYVKIAPKPLSLNQLILILSLAHVRKIVLICLLNISRLYTPPTCPKILQFLKIPFFDLPNNCGSDGLPGDFLYKIRQVIFLPLWFFFGDPLMKVFFLICWKSDLSHQF